MLRVQKVHHQGYLQGCLGILVAFLTMPYSQALSQSIVVQEPTQIYQLSTPQQLTIPVQQLGDILPGSGSEKVGNGQSLLAPPTFNMLVSRELPGLWQMRVPINQVGSLYATYELRGVNGQVNGFSNNEHTNQAMQVSMQPLPIVEISRDEATNTALIEGGVRLLFDLSLARSAGKYGGVLSVIVNQRE
jgi:hypothetical protein